MIARSPCTGNCSERGIRWLLLVLACLAAISLFLLATASANTELFARRYDLLLVLKQGRLQAFGPKDEVLSKVLQRDTPAPRPLKVVSDMGGSAPS